MSAGHGFISGLLSALLGIAGFGLVLSLRFPEQLMFGELRPLYSSPPGLDVQPVVGVHPFKSDG